MRTQARRIVADDDRNWTAEMEAPWIWDDGETHCRQEPAPESGRPEPFIAALGVGVT